LSIQPLSGRAPDFTLDHVLGHTVSLSDYRGRKVVVVFGGTGSAGQLKEGIMTIRRSLRPEQVTVMSVSDLSAAPRPARRIVKGKLKKVYEDAVNEASALVGGGDPDIIMLTDWSGQIAEEYGVDASDEAVAVAIDEQGTIIGHGSGDQLGPQILAALGVR
jgi:cytochrome oxidase Cu insertion factor (SCO1/SenC/PrrC family)